MAERAIRIFHQGQVDLDLGMNKVFKGAFTLTAWVMPEFTYNHESAIFGHSGVGRFMVGQGNYRHGNGGTFTYEEDGEEVTESCAGDPVLTVQVGSSTRRYLAPGYKRYEWNHIALVRYPSVKWAKSLPDMPQIPKMKAPKRWYYALYVNGDKLTPFKRSGKACDFTFEDASTPYTTQSFKPEGGNLRVGRTNTPDQPFHGWIDEVAVYGRAMTSAEVQAHAAQASLTVDADLVAGWTFDDYPSKQGVDPRLLRSYQTNPAALRRPISSPRSGADAAIFDDPNFVSPSQNVRTLPFQAGEIWRVIQEPDTRHGSHNGFAAYCWDFGRVDDGTCQPVSTDADVCAATPGAVVNVLDKASGAGKVHTDVGAGEWDGHMHIRAGSFAAEFPTAQPLPDRDDPSTWVAVAAGEKLGTTEDVELHLHYEAIEMTGPTGAQERLMGKPVHFRDYQISTDCDTNPGNPTWTPVSAGMPERGQFIRRV